MAIEDETNLFEDFSLYDELVAINTLEPIVDLGSFQGGRYVQGLSHLRFSMDAKTDDLVLRWSSNYIFHTNTLGKLPTTRMVGCLK